jgi:type IV secretory pathway VirD2 relaxase
LIIDPDYITQGLRRQAEALVSLELGPRTPAEVAASLDREVEAERWTSLDRTLKGLIGRTAWSISGLRRDWPIACRRV